GGIVPIPRLDRTKGRAEPVRPIALRARGLTREGTSLRAITRGPGPLPPAVVNIGTAPPCARLYVGQPTTSTPSSVQLFGLLAVVSATDGITYFIDVPNRRLVNYNRYTLANDAGLTPTPDQVPSY